VTGSDEVQLAKICTRIHGVTNQKTKFFIPITVKSSNLTNWFS